VRECNTTPFLAEFQLELGIKNLLCICILKNKQATLPPSGAAQQGGGGGGAAQQPQPPHERRLEINLLKASSHPSSCIEIQTTASGGRGGVSEVGVGIRPIKILNNIHVELDGSRQVGEAVKKYLLDGISAQSTNTGPAMMMRSCTDKMPRFGTHHWVGMAMLGLDSRLKRHKITLFRIALAM
jgi:hypothetical protein